MTSSLQNTGGELRRLYRRRFTTASDPVTRRTPFCGIFVPQAAPVGLATRKTAARHHGRGWLAPRVIVGAPAAWTPRPPCRAFCGTNLPQGDSVTFPPTHPPTPRKPISLQRLVSASDHSSLARACEVQLVKRLPMETRITSDFEQIDHKTCLSICDAVGERLQQSLHPDTELSSRLRELVDELRRRDGELY
jgi:hypothetical protein